MSRRSIQTGPVWISIHFHLLLQSLRFRTPLNWLQPLRFWNTLQGKWIKEGKERKTLLNWLPEWDGRKNTSGVCRVWLCKYERVIFFQGRAGLFTASGFMQIPTPLLSLIWRKTWKACIRSVEQERKVNAYGSHHHYANATAAGCESYKEGWKMLHLHWPS